MAGSPQRWSCNVAFVDVSTDRSRATRFYGAWTTSERELEELAYTFTSWVVVGTFW